MYTKSTHTVKQTCCTYVNCYLNSRQLVMAAQSQQATQWTDLLLIALLQVCHALPAVQSLVFEFNNRVPHQVRNAGPGDRVHVIIDVSEQPHQRTSLLAGSQCDYQKLSMTCVGPDGTSVVSHTPAPVQLAVAGAAQDVVSQTAAGVQLAIAGAAQDVVSETAAGVQLAVAGAARDMINQTAAAVQLAVAAAAPKPSLVLNSGSTRAASSS